MMYRFDRKRLVVVKIALVLLCLLAYTAGVVTGIALWMPTQTDIALLHANGRGAAPTMAAARLPVGPPAIPAVRPPVLPAPAAAGMPVKAASAPEPAPEPARPSPMSAMAAPLPAPAQTPPVAAAGAAPGVAAAAGAALAPEDDVFSLQIGTFRDPKNAKLLQADLKERGYAATILTAMDSEQREWHAVRIHGYKTLASAAHAAAEFTAKERMQALIRHSDGL